MVVKTKEEAIKAEENIRKLLSELELEELSQNRLEKMFKYYNKNWENYYGTDKYFIMSEN
jgi:benzoyl-CoA reductase/2-hydroxyglutaryl-CoA dehydratase subunit BcrC/BadD/HgdB